MTRSHQSIKNYFIKKYALEGKAHYWIFLKMMGKENTQEDITELNQLKAPKC